MGPGMNGYDGTMLYVVERCRSLTFLNIPEEP